VRPKPLRAQRGSAAERAVAKYLVAHGFAIVAMNLRVGMLELDVIARKETLIVVVEVRTRGASAWTSGFGSIDGTKRQRIRRAGERLWQRRYKNDASIERMRFDAASVTFVPGRAPAVEYVAAASSFADERRLRRTEPPGRPVRRPSREGRLARRKRVRKRTGAPSWNTCRSGRCAIRIPVSF
jgi:putative endonuclease